MQHFKTAVIWKILDFQGKRNNKTNRTERDSGQQENRIYRGQSQPPTERTYQVISRKRHNDHKRVSACAGI